MHLSGIEHNIIKKDDNEYVDSDDEDDEDYSDNCRLCKAVFTTYDTFDNHQDAYIRCETCNVCFHNEFQWKDHESCDQ